MRSIKSVWRECYKSYSKSYLKIPQKQTEAHYFSPSYCAQDAFFDNNLMVVLEV